MDLTEAEVNLIRQWFNAVQDLNPKYLEAEDYALARRIHAELGAPVPQSLKGK
jgi:hypothetical protein